MKWLLCVLNIYDYKKIWLHHENFELSFIMGGNKMKHYLMFLLLVMCLGEMTTQNGENCIRKLFSAIGKVLTAKENYFLFSRKTQERAAHHYIKK